MVPQSPWYAVTPKMSERPVAFLCDDEIVVLAADVPKIVGALQKFIASTSAADVQVKWLKRAASEPVVAHALSRIEKLLANPPAEIHLPQQWWNAILFGLNEVGCEVVLTDGSYE
jgi:hypothetical protein